MLTIYHNNRCGKSRAALAILAEKGLKFKIVEYLKDVPSEEELKSILDKLSLKPQDVIRTKETVYIEKYKGKSLSDKEWIRAILENPILLERPIIIHGNKAVIARPPEKVLEII